MHKFHNRDFDAPNVVELDIDPAICAEFNHLVNEQPDGDFTLVQPDWTSDMKWISPNTINAFRYFQTRFNRLGVAEQLQPYLDIEKSVRLFSGFLVSRTFCNAPNFHRDWIDTNNEAFTLLTPITDSPADFGLQYHRKDGSIASYSYRPGKAIIFGDDFLHSTQPGRSDTPVVLLCFTFGTDRMQHWPAISKTAGSQGNLMRLPDGRFLVHDIDDPRLAI